MAKKLIIVWLSMTVWLFSTVVTFAEDTVQGQFLNRNIYINGNQIANHQLADPLFIYQGVTYFPLSVTMQEMLGVGVEINQESRTILLKKTAPSRSALDQTTLKCNLVNQKVSLTEGYTVALQTDRPTVVSMSDNIYSFRSPTTVPIDLGNYKILKKGAVFYLPFRALTGSNGLNWDIMYDDYSGLYVSTLVGVPAGTYFDKAESQYNKGLANYIRYRNKSVTLSDALELAFLFKHESDVYKVDETLLIAMAEKESTFRTNCVTDGAIGIMQILSSTAANYGVSRNQLFDPHVNIQFGAMYISARLDRYGVTSTALSAYNRGSVPVSRGTAYTTRYSTRILNAEESLTSYLTKNGYGLGK